MRRQTSILLEKRNRSKKQKRKAFAAGLFLSAFFMLGGCGSDFPNLTDEQVERAGEYAAMTLLQYDSLNRRRLMSLEDMQVEESRRKAWEQAASKARQEEKKEKEEPGQENTDQGSGKEKESAASFGELGDGFVLPDGVTIKYLGEKRCAHYPEENGFISISAGAGKELLVLKFALNNGSDGSQNIDLMEQDNSYVVTVNGNYSRKCLSTLLMDDLSSYQGKLLPGESEELVLLIEVDEGMTMESVRLKIKNDRIESTILLFP